MGSVVSKCSTNMMLGAALASRCTMQLDAAEAGCIVMQMHNSEMHFPCISICVCIVCSLGTYARGRQEVPLECELDESSRPEDAQRPKNRGLR